MSVNRNEPQPAKPGPVLPLLVFVLVLGTFLPCLRNGFVNLDDTVYASQNPHVIHGLTWDGLKWIWGDTDSSNWHPLTWISHMLDNQLFGSKPAGHHATSVLIHAVNCTLLFLLLLKMTGARWRSFAAATLFGLHPLRVESVAWVSERKDVLSGLFCLLAMLAYARYAEADKAGSPKRKTFFIGTLVLFVLALLSKPMAVTLPFMLLLLDCWPLQRWPRIPARLLVREKIPLFILAAASAVVTFIMQQQGNSVTPGDALPLPLRLANAVVSYVRYLGKTFWPTDLCVMYPHPGNWPPEILAGAALLLTVVTALAVWQWRTMPYLAVGWFWFLGTLIPAIGIVQVGRQAMADRYTYLPSIGLWFALVWMAEKITQRWRQRETLARAVLAASLLACIVLTIHQIGYWKDSKTLFAHAMDSTKRNWIVAGFLAGELQHDGETEAAIDMYNQALQLNPYHNEVRLKLANLLLKQKRAAEALPYFQKAVALDTNDADAHKGLGASLQDLGQLDEAIDEFNQVIRLKPEDADAYSDLGNCYGMKGRTDDAIRCLEMVVKLEPKVAANHRDLGAALAIKGRLDEAIDQFQQATELDPSDTRAKQYLDSARRDKAKAAR